jgi:hypothetical protein
MSLLIYDLEANKTMNLEIFSRILYVYDQHLVYKHRTFFKKYETTIPYTSISKVYLTEGIFFSEVEIVAPGLKEDIKLRFTPKRGSRISKFLIDEKIKDFTGKSKPKDLENIRKIENYIERIYELKKEKKITAKEAIKRREVFFKKIEKNSRIG